CTENRVCLFSEMPWWPARARTWCRLRDGVLLADWGPPPSHYRFLLVCRDSYGKLRWPADVLHRNGTRPGPGLEKNRRRPGISGALHRQQLRWLLCTESDQEYR